MMKSFDKFGYEIVNNYVKEKHSKEFFSSVVKVCKFYAQDFFPEKEYKNLWTDPKFSQNLIDLRNKERKKFASIYDTLLKSNLLHIFCYKNKLDNLASKFLKVKKDEISVRNLTLRMDVPDDKKNIYGWHQDSAYDNFNLDPKNGIVLWTPLINTNKRNGTLQVMPGSHVEDNCCYLKKTGGKFGSKQILVEKKYLDKYKSKSVEVKKNSCLVCLANLFHASGFNSSKQVRFVFIVRFNKILSKDFIHYIN